MNKNKPTRKLPKVDEYGVVCNSFETFEYIAFILNQTGSIIISWTDERGTQFNILFTKLAFPFLQVVGPIQNQGGLSGDDLFVSVMRWGAFGFEVSKDHIDTHSGYYDEKLGAFRMGGVTAEKLAELINGVKRELLKSKAVKK